MKRLVILLMPLFFCCQTNESKVAPESAALSPDTVSQTSESDNNEATVEKLRAGFYVAIPDTSHSKGYKVRDKNEYYFLGAAPAVSLQEIDSVYVEFSPILDRYALTLQFNEVGAKEWFDFTTQNNGRQVALVLKEEIFQVATIAAPISSGKTVLTNAPAKRILERLKETIEKEIKKARG
jgi:preprotein translocase subunit SecD